jgi:hypothetical protein
MLAPSSAPSYDGGIQTTYESHWTRPHPELPRGPSSVRASRVVAAGTLY